MNETQLKRLQRIDSFIIKKATGTAAELATKLNIFRSTLIEELALMKQYGADIKYDKQRRTYYYETDGHFEMGFKEKIA